MNYTLYQAPLTDDLKKRIYEGFAEHAIAQTGMNGKSDSISFIASKDSQFLGPVVIEIFWGQLHVKYLFVEESYRGQGIAKDLLQHALAFGKDKGCQIAFVETMNFQAPEFYQKLGFVEEFIRRGFTQGTSFHYLKKEL